MAIDINDPAVLDSQIVEIEDMKAMLSCSRQGVTRAIHNFKIPQPMDSNGLKGTPRWTVGMLRKWNVFIGEKALEASIRHYEKTKKWRL